LWMEAGETARVFGAGYTAKKQIVKRIVSGVELGVIATGLTNKGLGKLETRLAALKPKATLEAAD
jgi:hypothetical protein